MSETMVEPTVARERLQEGDRRWKAAVRAFDSYPARMRTLAAAAEYESRAFTLADLANITWKARQGAAQLYLAEGLHDPDKREGPAHLWDAFDAAVGKFGKALEGDSIAAIADAFAAISAAATAIADACEPIDEEPPDEETAGTPPASPHGRRARRA